MRKPEPILKEESTDIDHDDRYEGRRICRSVWYTKGNSKCRIDLRTNKMRDAGYKY